MQINTESQDFVQKAAPIKPNQGSPHYVKIRSINSAGFEPVYNMEVQDHHNFSVEGGLVVHNCIDAVRYAMESVSALKTAIVPR